MAKKIAFLVVPLLLSVTMAISCLASSVQITDASEFWGSGKFYFRNGEDQGSTLNPIPLGYGTTPYPLYFPYENFSDYIDDSLKDTYTRSGFFDYPGYIINGTQISQVEIITEGYIYMEFDKSIVLYPGQTIEFFIMPFYNSWNPDNSVLDPVYFHYISDVSLGSYYNGEWVRSSVSLAKLTRRAGVSGSDTFAYPMTKVEITNDYHEAYMVGEGIMVKFRESTKWGEPASSGVRTITGTCSCGVVFSNIIRYGEAEDVVYSPFEDYVISGFKDIEGGLKDVEDGLDDVEDKLGDIEDAIKGDASDGDIPDYDEIKGNPSYDVGDLVGEDEAVGALGGLMDDVNLTIDSRDFVRGANFWQQVFNLIFNIPAAMVMVSVVSVTIVVRSLLGR